MENSQNDSISFISLKLLTPIFRKLANVKARTAWNLDPFLFTKWPLIFWTRKIPHTRSNFWHLDAVARPFPGLLLRSVGIPPIGLVTWCWDENRGKLKPKGPFLESLEMAIHPSTNPSLGWGTHVRFQGVFLLLTPCRLSLLRIDDGCRLWYFYIYKLDTECQSMTSSKYSKLFIGSDNPPGIVVTYPKWPLLCWVKSYSSNVEYK